MRRVAVPQELSPRVKSSSRGDIAVLTEYHPCRYHCSNQSLRRIPKVEIMKHNRIKVRPRTRHQERAMSCHKYSKIPSWGSSKKLSRGEGAAAWCPPASKSIYIRGQASQWWAQSSPPVSGSGAWSLITSRSRQTRSAWCPRQTSWNEEKMSMTTTRITSPYSGWGRHKTQWRRPAWRITDWTMTFSVIFLTFQLARLAKNGQTRSSRKARLQWTCKRCSTLSSNQKILQMNPTQWRTPPPQEIQPGIRVEEGSLLRMSNEKAEEILQSSSIRCQSWEQIRCRWNSWEQMIVAIRIFRLSTSATMTVRMSHSALVSHKKAHPIQSYQVSQQVLSQVGWKRLNLTKSVCHRSILRRAHCRNRMCSRSRCSHSIRRTESTGSRLTGLPRRLSLQQLLRPRSISRRCPWPRRAWGQTSRCSHLWRMICQLEPHSRQICRCSLRRRSRWHYLGTSSRLSSARGSQSRQRRSSWRRSSRSRPTSPRKCRSITWNWRGSLWRARAWPHADRPLVRIMACFWRHGAETITAPGFRS